MSTTPAIIPANDADRVAALHELGILDTPSDVSFDNLTRLAAGLFNVPIALVSLVDSNRQWFKSSYGLCASETSRDVSFCAYVISEGNLLVIDDASQDKRFAQNPLVTGEPHIRFYAGAPLRSGTGFILGTLCLIDTQPRQFSAAQREHLELLARQVEQLLQMHHQTRTLEDEIGRANVVSARYEAIIKGAAAGIVRINGRGRIIEVNRFVCTMLGYAEDELIGQNVKMLMPERWAKDHDGYLDAYQRTGQAKVIGTGREVDAQHRNGDTIPVHLAISEVALGAVAEDHDERQFIGILSDLRDVRAARERERQERQLLELLHRGLTDYRALVSGNTLWAFLKQALRNLTGSEYALIGEVIDDAAGTPSLKIHAITDLSWSDESRDLMRKLVEGDLKLNNADSMLGRVFARGETIISENAMTDPRGGHLPPGHPRLSSLLAVPITDRGKVIGMYALANAPQGYDQTVVEWLKPFTSTCALLINLYRQMNEQKQLLQTVQQAKEQVERASQAKTDFLSSMSHELRTPLNAILGFAQLLQNSRQPLPERPRRQVEQIIRSGRHLLSLINEVLDLARIESGKMSLSVEPIRAHEVIRDALDLIRPLAAQNTIYLDVPPPGECSTHIMGDYTRVKQILINLLSNAVKYNRPGGSVSLRCQAGPGSCRISIRDTGIGIAPERQGELFQPFNRLGAESGGIEGTGVGLALTRKLVLLMDGSIGVNSEPDKGSEFWFELPLADNPPVSAPLSSPETEQALPGVTDARYRVLYIEDNPANQRLMQDLFADLDGTALVCAHTAELGIELACSDPPDLILMDIDLPGMNGFAAQKLLRQNPLTAMVPVVGISADASSINVRKAREAGFKDYITKPFDLAALVKRVDALLEDSTP
ncbi:MAG: ATP-binding protein [Pusillimonas sp.]